MSLRPEIMAMRGYVPGEQPPFGKFIKLNTNENPYPPSPAVQRAIGKTIQMGLQRYPDPLATAFRTRAAEILGVEPDWILCGNGSDDILTIVTRAFVGEGDLLRLPTPSYVLYKTLAQLQGAKAEEIPFEPGWTLGEAFTRPAERLKLAFVPNPNSPSGTMLRPEEIAGLAARLPCPLLVDEAYADFADGHCLGLVAKHENVMVSRTLSKSYGLAGLRFGFLVAQPQIIAELRKVKDSYNTDALSISGATAAIDDRGWLAENLAKVKATRGKLTAGLRELGFATTPSQANFVWCTHSSGKHRDIYERLKAAQILVRYMDYAGWGDGLRISVGTDEQTEALLTVLAGIMENIV